MTPVEQLELPIDGGRSAARPGRVPLVVSASRRTDLPGFYPARLVERLDRLVDRRREPLYGLVLWTRHPAALLEEPLRGLLEGGGRNAAVNLTITGLGGSRLEPGAPSTDDAIRAALELVDLLGGQVARIRWRYDPLLRGLSTVRLFESIAGPLAAAGAPTVTVSFPAATSLKGPLGPRYAAAGIAPWPGRLARARHAASILDAARGFRMRVLACCQPKLLEDVPGLEAACCVPLEVLEGLHPEGTPFPYRKDRRQRRHCTCPPSEDIGDYELDRCGTGCVYCYSRAGGP